MFSTIDEMMPHEMQAHTVKEDAVNDPDMETVAELTLVDPEAFPRMTLP